MQTFALSEFDRILPAKPTETLEVDTDLARARKYAATFSQASEGQRNQMTYGHAARLREKFMLSQTDIFDLLSEWNQRNSPPLEEEELRSIVKDVDKYAKRPAGSGYQPSRAPKSPSIQKETSEARQGTPQGIDQIIGDSISGKRNVIKLPWPRLSKLTMALLSGTTTFLCGGIGARKSFVILQILLDLIQQQIRVAVLWLEEDVPYYQNRALAQLAEMPELMSPEFVKANPSLVQELMDEYRTLVEAIGKCSWDFAHRQPTQDDVAAWIESRASEGYRILIVDPITATSRSSEPWTADNRFIQRLKRAAVDTGSSIIAVTHSVKSIITKPDLNLLAGSAAFARFCQCTLWLESHDPKNSQVITPCGKTEYKHNSTFHILKSRNGPGAGLRIAMNAENLSLREIGIITKKSGDKK
jgi:hypothetical protein